jgi:5'-nucleotidase
VNETKTFLIDMDGTLVNYEDRLIEDMKKLMSPEEKEPEDWLDELKPHLKARMTLIKSQPGWWRKLPPLKLGMDVFTLAQLMNFQIEILTKGPQSNRAAWAEKAECIDAFFGREVIMNVVGKEKKNYFGHVLCEDWVPFLDDWLKHRPRGLGILIHNKKNADYKHENVIRYDGTNLEEIAKHLKAVSMRKSGEHWREYL